MERINISIENVDGDISDSGPCDVFTSCFTDDGTDSILVVVVLIPLVFVFPVLPFLVLTQFVFVVQVRCICVIYFVVTIVW